MTQPLVPPGFLAATVLGCLVLGPLVANGSVEEFMARQRWGVIAASALALRQTGVTGILDGNPVTLIHGTLWTIKYEFDCYILLGMLGALGLLRKRWLGATFAAIALALIVLTFFAGALPVTNTGLVTLVMSSPHRWPELFPFFFAGTALYAFREHLPSSLPLCVAAAGTFLASLFVRGAYWATLLAGCYAVVYLCLNWTASVVVFGRRVDLSYGVYLYAWPVQQLIVHATGNALSPITLFAATMPVSLAVAYASWYLIEAPALAWARGPGP